MLPRKSRLPYEEFRAFGYRKEETPYFSVRAKRNSFPESRFGVVIGTSAIKSAARRTFWRRQAKAVFSDALRSGMVATGKRFDILVVFRSRAALPKKDVFRKTLADAMASLTSHL